MTCPWCQSGNIDIPTVDIGVGEQQCGPMACLDCGASEMRDVINPDPQSSAEERERGWYRGRA